MTMRLSLLAVTAALAFATTAAFAATPQAAAKKTLSPQQQRMADCSHQSAGKKGAEHKAFMSACLKGKSTDEAKTAAAPAAAAAPAPSAKETQQEKMKSCNTDAKTKALKGAARKTFMSSCLKGDAAAAPAAAH